MQDSGNKQPRKAPSDIAESDSIEIKEVDGMRDEAARLMPVPHDFRTDGREHSIDVRPAESAPVGANDSTRVGSNSAENDKSPKRIFGRRRKRRRIADLFVGVALSLIFVPIAIGAGKLMFDPAAKPTAIAATFVSADHAVGALTQALAVRDDPTLRLLRAEANLANANYSAAESDYKTLALGKLLITDTVPLRLAELQIRRGLYDTETRKYLLEVISRRDTGVYGNEAIGDLVLAGDFREAIVTAKLPRPEWDEGLFAQTKEAVAADELGRSNEASKIFNHILGKKNDYSSYWERLDYTIWLLNTGNVAEARKNIDGSVKQLRELDKDSTSSAFLAEFGLLDGWCLFEEGKLDQALDETEEILNVRNHYLASEDFLTQDLIIKSVHRLRAEVFARKGDEERAKNEMKLSGSGPVPVNIYIPRKYRQSQ